MSLLLIVALAAAGLVRTFRSEDFRPVLTQSDATPLPQEGLAIRRWSIVLPDSAPLTFVGAASLGIGRTGLAISPDGSRLVYVAARGGTTQLYLRELDRLAAAPLASTEGAYQPFFSPDGAWIAFFVDDQLKKLSLRSGHTVTIGAVSEPIGGAWAPDGRILVADNQGHSLIWLSSGGGSPEPVDPQPDARITNPQFVAGSDWILHWAGDGILSLTSLNDGRRYAFTSNALVPRERADVSKLLFGTNPFYLESGHLVYVSGDGIVMVLPFDFRRRAVLGPPIPVLDSVRLESETGGAQFAVSRGGTFVYARGGNMRHNQFVWVDHATGRVDTLPFPKAIYGAFQLSPDGRRILVRVQPAAGPAEVWILDLDHLARARLETLGVVGGFVRWWPDGRHVLYAEFGPGGGRSDVVIVRQVIGSQQRDTLFYGMAALEPTPDGATIAINDGASWFLVPVTQHQRLPLQRVALGFPAISPDGQWLAYTDRRAAGRSEVYVVNVANQSAPYKVSSDGGEEAVWSPDGGSLVYRNRQQWLKVAVTTTGGFRSGRPKVLFAGPFAQVPGWSSDISADGKRQLLLIGPHEPAVAELSVVTNWLAYVNEVASGGEPRSISR